MTQKRMAWYKAYPRDFFEGTVGMSADLKGAYRLVLDLIYLHGGQCPDDAAYISMMLGMSRQKWVAIRKKLIDMPGKLKVGGGCISNYRADEEVSASHESSKRQSAAARARWAKRGADKSMPPHKHPHHNPDHNPTHDHTLRDPDCDKSTGYNIRWECPTDTEAEGRPDFNRKESFEGVIDEGDGVSNVTPLNRRRGIAGEDC